jgi:hypothetical protein
MSPQQEMLTAAALLTLGLVLWLGRPPKLGRRPDPSHSASASPSVEAARAVRRGPFPRWFTYVLISRADRDALRGLRSWGRLNFFPGFWPFALWLEDAGPGPDRGIVMWSTHAAPHVAAIAALTRGGRWALLPIDPAPLPAALSHCVVFEYTNAADIARQWRVRILGAPPDHVNRPWRGDRRSGDR